MEGVVVGQKWRRGRTQGREGSARSGRAPVGPGSGGGGRGRASGPLPGVLLIALAGLGAGQDSEIS